MTSAAILAIRLATDQERRDRIAALEADLRRIEARRLARGRKPVLRSL